MRVNDVLLALVLGVAIAHNTYECTTALTFPGHAERLPPLLNEPSPPHDSGTRLAHSVWRWLAGDHPAPENR